VSVVLAVCSLKGDDFNYLRLLLLAFILLMQESFFGSLRAVFSMLCVFLFLPLWFCFFPLDGLVLSDSWFWQY